MSTMLGQAQQGVIIIGPDLSPALALIAQSVRDRTNDIVEFWKGDRLAAAEAGVEVIALELSGIKEGGALDRIAEATAGGGSVSISPADLDQLGRAERLIGEAVSHVTTRLTVAERLERAAAAAETSALIFLLAAVASLIGLFSR